MFHAGLTVIAALLSFIIQIQCDDSTGLSFRYVTSYNKEGRFMTKDDIEKNSVNVLKPIIFIVGGLTEEDKKNSNWNLDLSKAYTDKYISNVFIVDWILSDFSQSLVTRATSLAKQLEDFIQAIYSKSGEQHFDIHLIGIAIGCEIVKPVKKSRNTCLDPFYYHTNLKDFDGIFDAVHSKWHNDTPQIGQVDFYLIGENSGLKSTSEYARSVNSNEIKGFKCVNSDKFIKNECLNEETVIFGENTDRNAKGTFFVKV